MEFAAEQSPQPRPGVRRVHHHPGGGQPDQRAGPRHGAGVERRRVLHVVVAAQPQWIAAADGAVRGDAGRQPVERPQRGHRSAGGARPVDRVVPAQIEGRRLLRGGGRAGGRGAAGGRTLRRPEPGAEDPPHRAALVGCPPQQGRGRRLLLGAARRRRPGPARRGGGRPRRPVREPGERRVPAAADVAGERQEVIVARGPGVAGAVPDQHESGAVGPVYRPAGAQNVLHQPQVLARRHVAPAADLLQVAAGDQQRAADQEVAVGLPLAGEAVDHPIRGGKVDELGGLAHQLRARVLAREHQVPDVVGAVAVVVVHLGQQLPAGRGDRGVQRRAQRRAARHAHDPAGKRQLGRAPLDADEGRFVPVQRQHQLQPRIGLRRHRGERLRHQRRAPGRQQHRHVRQVRRAARPRGVVPQRRPAQADAAQLARAGIQTVHAGRYQSMQFSAEQRLQPGVGVRRVQHHPGRGQPGQRAGPRRGPGVERRRVLHVVVAAQPQRVPGADRAVRPDPRRQPLQRPQRRHPGAGGARPVNGVAGPQIEGRRRLARPRRAAAAGAVPRPQPGAEEPPHRPALVERPQRYPLRRAPQRRLAAVAPGVAPAAQQAAEQRRRRPPGGWTGILGVVAPQLHALRRPGRGQSGRRRFRPRP